MIHTWYDIDMIKQALLKQVNTITGSGVTYTFLAESRDVVARGQLTMTKKESRARSKSLYLVLLVLYRNILTCHRFRAARPQAANARF